MFVSTLPALADPADPAAAPEPTGETYLNEPLAVYEELDRIHRVVDSGRHDRAVEMYQALVTRFHRALARDPCEGGDAADPARVLEKFISVPELVFREMESAAPQVLIAYRRRYEDTAAREIAAETARRSAHEMLHPPRAARRYFPTAAARAAFEAAGDAAMEAAQFSAAKRIYLSLLKLHPDRARMGNTWEAKAVLCDAWMGDPAGLEQLVETLKTSGDSTPVPWAGTQQTLLEFVQAASEVVQAARRDSRLQTAPAADSPLRAEARLWRFTDFQPSTAVRERAAAGADAFRDGILAAAHAIGGDAGVADIARGRVQDVWDDPPSETLQRALASGRHLGLMPISDQGWLYVGDARSVWAIDPRRPDAPVWHYWLSDGSRAEAATDDDPPSVHTLSAAGGAIYAHLDPLKPEAPDENARASSMLVCLDAKTGQPRWKNDLTALANRFDEYRIDAAPLIVHDQAIAVVRRRKLFGFEACLLVSFDVRDGTILWQTHLGEAATGGYGYYRCTRSFPAVDSGLIFVQSNLGTIAAVDARDGHVVWLRRYATRADDGTSGFWPSSGENDRPWQSNPVLLWNGRVVAAPQDSDDLFVLNGGDGELISRIPRDKLRSPETLLGILGDRLVALGRWVVAFDLRKGEAAWERQLPAGRLFGRGALTAGTIFVPTDGALLQFPIDGGPPERYGWGLAAAGNVLPMPDQIVIASGDSLAGLVQKDVALAGLQAQLTADVHDPLPAMSMAELMFESGDLEAGMQAIAEAARRLSERSLASRPAGEEADDQVVQRLRVRLFRDTMRYTDMMLAAAERQAAAASAPATPPGELSQHHQWALALLDYASLNTPDIDAQIRFRLKQADVHLCAGRIPPAIRSYQQLLSDAGLARRHVAWERLSTGERLADLRRDPLRPGGRDAFPSPQGDVAVGAYARERIARLILNHGREQYAEVERQAGDRLTVASATDDADALLSVAERFPNSLAAPEALIRRARLLRNGGRAAEAIRSLQRAMGLRDQVDQPTLLRELALAYVADHRPRAARRWLERAVREHPAVRFEHDGKPMGFQELQMLLLGDAPPAETRWHVRFPVKRAWSREFSAPPFLLDAPLSVRADDEAGADAAARRPDEALLVFCDGKLMLHDALTGEPLWPAAADCPERAELMAIDSRLAVCATRHQLLGIALADGRLAWSVGRYPEEAERPEVDPESITQWIAHAVSSTHLFSATDRGELLAVRRRDGQVDWRLDTQPKIGTRLSTDGRWVAYAAWDQRQNIVVLVEASSGRAAHTISLAADRPLQKFAFADDGRLIALTATTAHAIDPDAGDVLWNIPLDGRALLNSVEVADDGLYLSTDDTRISRFDLLTGRLSWMSPAISSQAANGFRVEAVEDVLHVATQHTLAAVDSASGNILWQRSDVEVLDLFPPAYLRDDVLLLTSAPPKAKVNGGAPLAEGPDPSGLVLRRFDRRTGAERPTTEPESAAPVQTRPASLQGDVLLRAAEDMVVRQAAVILRHGQTITGYTAGAQPR